MSKSSYVLVAILIVLNINSVLFTYNTGYGIDFYQYWGVGMAHKLSGGKLSSPYVNIEQYDSLLSSVIDREMRLTLANALGRLNFKYSLEMNVTPLGYAVFALMPQNYSLSYGIFLSIRAILFLTALYLLCPPKTVSSPIAMSGILLTAFHEPIGFDARMGNLSMLQFFSAAALAYYCESHLKKLSPREALCPLVAVLSCMAFLVLLKPTFGLIAGFLAVSIAAQQGIKLTARAGIIASLVGIVLLVIPSVYFNSWSVWKDWLDYLAPGSKIPSYDITLGNYSAALFFSKSHNIPFRVIAITLGLVFIASCLLAIIISKHFKSTVSRILCNPYLVSSLAVIITMTLSPLVWLHYYVLTLLPALWMVNMPQGLTICRVMGAMSMFLSSGILVKVLNINTYYLPYIYASSLVPLWIGILIIIATHPDMSCQ